MEFRKKKQEQDTWNTPDYRKAKKRVGSMSTHDLLGWADDVSIKMAQLFSEYSRERDKTVRTFLLSELSVAISGMMALTEELSERDKQ